MIYLIELMASIELLTVLQILITVAARSLMFDHTVEENGEDALSLIATPLEFNKKTGKTLRKYAI